MSTDGIVRFKELRIGDAFTFYEGPGFAVFVKSRGGFRRGLGGELHSCSPTVPVYRYTGTIDCDSRHCPMPADGHS